MTLTDLTGSRIRNWKSSTRKRTPTYAARRTPTSQLLEDHPEREDGVEAAGIVGSRNSTDFLFRGEPFVDQGRFANIRSSLEREIAKDSDERASCPLRWDGRPFIVGSLQICSIAAAAATIGVFIMVNKDQVKGAAKQVKGAVKEAAGKATGNRQMQAEGAVEKTAGKVQKGFGDAKQKVKDARSLSVGSSSQAGRREPPFPFAERSVKRSLTARR